MSRETVYVLFPDGEVRYALDNTTVNSLWPRLFDTVDEAWKSIDAYRDPGFAALKARCYPPDDYDRSQGETVQIYDSYMEWTGRATREFITSEWQTDSDAFYAEREAMGPTQWFWDDNHPEWVTVIMRTEK